MYVLIPVFDDPAHQILKEQATACPACDAGHARLTVMVENRAIRPRYAVACGACKHLGALGKDVADAIKKWNGTSGLLPAFKRVWGKKRQKQRPLFRAHRHNRTFL
jgi:hypothetical protein